MRKLFYICFIAFSVCVLGCSTPDRFISAGNEESITSTESGTATEDIETAETDLSSSQEIPAYGISVTAQEDNRSYYSKEDQTVLVLDASASYPEVFIDGNAAVSDKINASIAAELDTFWNFEEENASYADEAYVISLDPPDYEFTGYSASFSYEMKRCDDKLISFVFLQTDYSGGAHGNSWSYGVTFDTATGERLYLENLSNDYTAFYQMLLTELNAQAALPAYQDYLYDGIETDMESSLLKDSASWYFDRSGMTFISNPYVLGPYAAGLFEFNIPYERLSDLKSEYSYDGAYICKLFPGISVNHDINGDGTTDEICYSIITEDGFANPNPVLRVNGVDFSAQLNSLDLSYYWTEAYYLIDIDPEDTYTEIAISNENADHPSGTCTHFFRYDSSGDLVYLGNTAGIFSEDMQVRYNANGNLVLCDRDGDILE